MDMGFRVDHTLMMSVDLGLQGYTEERGQQFFKQLTEHVRSLPGVRDAAVSAYVPMGYDNSGVNVYPDGRVIDDERVDEDARAGDAVRLRLVGHQEPGGERGRDKGANHDGNSPSVSGHGAARAHGIR